MTGSTDREEWVAVARLGKTRGLRGELFARGFSSREDRYQELRHVFLFGRDGQPLGESPFEVERVWWHQGRLIFKFRGIDTIRDAEPLQGADVCIPLSERPVLPEGEYYQSDIIGCEVFERETEESLGRVTDWLEYGGPVLLQVEEPERKGHGELLIPLVREICVEIDVAAKRIVVDLPEGLKELNRPPGP
ncbi:MAG: 16S rRNA processing protein RimM [Bryobacteraceae bacterium]|nr:16S rRNA processing protein RimM [Bryobacteraceae bacterium]